MNRCSVELLWLPVGAETSRFQQASLRLWETIEAARTRRPRMALVHSALRVRTADGIAYAIELTPAFQRSPVPPVATGPVGMRILGRFELFRWALQCVPGGVFPDEQWATGEPFVRSTDCSTANAVLALAHEIPRYTWGRRRPGTGEMWTSDSVVSWLLLRAGIELDELGPPAGTRAPGWDAGIAVATRRRETKWQQS